MSALKVCENECVLSVTIDRELKRNALSLAVLDEIQGIFTDYSNDPDLKFVVLTSAGDKCFAAGGDLRELAGVKGADAAAAMARKAKATLSAVRSFPVPVVAALNGDALGGGAELAIACDMRVAAAHARIGFIQGRLAISSAWGGGVDLMRLVGSARALQFLSRSEMINASQALACGLINDAALDGENLDDVLERFTAPMRNQASQVMRAFKAVHIEGDSHGRSELDDVETLRFSETWAHADHDLAVERLISRTE